jgi:hypothetical protein
MSQKISVSHNDREQQLKDALRIKDAFARRCKELEADNQTLTLAAA